MLVFRRLRQRFILSNQSKRYALYAIGEVLLVMIGILMALQVNNWNEERSIRREFDSSFQKLIVDLENDASMLALLDSFYQESAKTGETIQRILTRDNDMDDIVHLRSFERLSNTNLSYSSSTYRSLVNTGLLYKIDNKELANLIDDYYVTIENQATITENMGIANRNIRDNDVLFPFQYMLRTTDDVFRADPKPLDWMNDDQSEIFQGVQYYLRIYVRQNKSKSDMVKVSLEKNSRLRSMLQK